MFIEHFDRRDIMPFKSKKDDKTRLQHPSDCERGP